MIFNRVTTLRKLNKPPKVFSHGSKMEHEKLVDMRIFSNFA